MSGWKHPYHDEITVKVVLHTWLLFFIYLCWHYPLSTQLGFDVSLDQRPEYQRARLKWKTGSDIPSVISTGVQQSSRLLSMADANCLLKLPPKSEECSQLNAGKTVNALLLKHL